MINLGFILLLVILVIFLYIVVMYNPKIEEFIAPVRAIRILRDSGLTTVREVMGCTDKELLALSGFGKESLLNVRERSKYIFSEDYNREYIYFEGEISLKISIVYVGNLCIL